MDNQALRPKHFLWIILLLCLHLTGSSLALPTTLPSGSLSTSFVSLTGSVLPTNPIASIPTATPLNSIKTSIPTLGVSSGISVDPGSIGPISPNPSIPGLELSTPPGLTNSISLNPSSTIFQTSTPTSGISPGVSSNSGSTNSGSSSYPISISTNDSPVNTFSTLSTLPGDTSQTISGSSTPVPEPSSSIPTFTNSPGSTGPTGSTSNSTVSLKPGNETALTYWVIILICVVCVIAVLLMLFLSYLLCYCLRQGNTSPICFPMYQTHNIPQTYQSSCR